MIIPCICTALFTIVCFISCLFNRYLLDINLGPGAGGAKINKIRALPSWNLHCNVHWSTVGQGEENLKVTTYPVPSLHSTGARRVNIYLSDVLTAPHCP